MSRDRAHLIKSWIAAVLWLIVIAIESTAYLSASNTSRFLYPILHFVFGLDHPQFEVWHHYIRKSGHFFGYGILSIFLFRAWRDTLPLRGDPKWALRWTNIALLGTLIVASLDEWHQSYLPSRTSRWQDVVIDTCGGIVAQMLLFLMRRWI